MTRNADEQETEPKMNGTGIEKSVAALSLVEDANGAKPVDRLVVGVDFGTTYSGVAACYSATPEDVDIIKTWPGGNGITSDKVPTEIAYDAVVQSKLHDSSETSNSTPAIRWGFQFKPEEPRLRCVKLFLDRNQQLPHFVSPLETASQLRKCGKTVIDAVTDYLTKIYEHTIETLTRRYGQGFIASTPIEFILTVPAVWSDAAKNATLQAAERAGMGNRHDLKLISEPEAAAVYTLKMIQPSGLAVGDNFVVCDAGGGTVDLIAYRVVHTDPLRIEESAVGTGSICGSALLNYRFSDFVASRIGQQQFKSMRPKTWNMGLKYFEEFVKRNFNEEEHSEVNVPLPGLADDEEAGLDSGFLTMSSEEVKNIFEPIIREVTALVEGQVEAIREKGGIVSGIILVGGFGQSNYLYTRLKQHFNAAPPPVYSEKPTHEAAESPQQSVQVLQPIHAWTAVVRGAVIRGIEGSVVEKRRSRWHYGTSYATVWDERKHPIEDRYWSPLWERWMVADRMQWHISKGTPISADQPISFHYTRNFRPGQTLVVEDDLIGCETEEAPDAMDMSLVKVCTLTTDLNAVPKGLFTRLTTTKGIEFDNLDFELVMKIESANLTFELRVDNQPYGMVKADFN
ncbi:heat shock 70 kDa 12B-like [Lecanosticta acicola]|uniref:Heat shock 70 kDa 12B-like n=1 Tax=Lecanosticta acicola TaxID=111012 RepID=A0AAI9EBH0_9PEZI|nr:heat shock 70 kDa 12B-like [Lecanosticta acicola]